MLYVDYTGNVIDPVTATIITAAIIGAVIGGVTYVGINLYNGTAITWGGLAKSIILGAVSGMASAGIANIASSIFTAKAVGFLQGAYHGAVVGSITGASGVVINAALSGQSVTLKAVLQGMATGAVIGAVVGGIQGAKYQKQIYNACEKIGVNPNDPVPATDEFLRQAQENWFPDAPMTKLKAFTVENPTASVKDFFTANPKTYAITSPTSIDGKLTGYSKVFFNPNTAFGSAKTLYFAMGHEFVHVSQYAALMNQNILSLRDIPDFDNMIEYHAYEFQHKVLGDFNGLNVVNDFQNVILY